MKTMELDQLHQLNCFLQIDLGFSEKKLLKIPESVKF